MRTNTREPICLSESASSWWESRSPEKQRAHIKRHPKGKYAKMVKNHSLALKPLTNASKRKRISLRGPDGQVDDQQVEQGADVDESEEEEESDDGEMPEEEEGQTSGADAEGDGDEEGETDAEPEKKDADFADPPKPQSPPPPPLPPRPDLTNSYRKALPARLKDGVRAFFAALDGGASPGTRADLSDSREDMERGNLPAVVKKMKPKSKEDADTLVNTIKATMPLAKMAALTVLGIGAAAAGASVLPALLACYYVNRSLSIESLSRSAVYSSLSGGDECDRLVNSFMDWAEGLDKDEIQEAMQSSEFVSTSSGLEVKVRRCPLDFYRGLDEDVGRRYLLVVGRQIRGFVMWDKKYGAPNKEANGWYSVLVDGFNENAYRSGRNAETLEPYTAIHRNDLVLVNPSRMPYDFAKQWAISVLRR